MTDPNVSEQDGSSGPTSPSLLARAAAQEPAAWERLVALYEPLVARWCRRWGLRGEDNRNVTQEVFVAVATALANFQLARGSFRAWLRTITRNEGIDYLRRHGPDVTGAGGSAALEAQQQLPAPADDDSAAELAEEKRLLYRRAVALIRASFSDQDWQAFEHVVCEDRRPAEVARALGVTVNKVYLAKSRILRKLRTEFRDLIDVYD